MKGQNLQNFIRAVRNLDQDQFEVVFAYSKTDLDHLWSKYATMTTDNFLTYLDSENMDVLCRTMSAVYGETYED